MTTTTLTAKTAYLKGWNASKNTTTYDLGAAEDRFAARYGGKYLDAYGAGWVDYASDYEKFESLPDEDGTTHEDTY